MVDIKLKKNVYGKNKELADKNRQLFDRNKIFVINMISSPGSGKTSLIEKIGPLVQSFAKVHVVEGDIETENDAQRLRDLGISATQIQTHGACHLDASMIEKALSEVDIAALDMVIIENVGNLVCPTSFDLGENMRIVVSSTTEGDDKPLKYPQAYHSADICVLNKIDLLPYVNCSTEQFEAGARRANAKIEIFHTSCVTADGIDQLCQRLKNALNDFSQE